MARLHDAAQVAHRDLDGLDLAELSRPVRRVGDAPAGSTVTALPTPTVGEPTDPRALPERFTPVATSEDGTGLVVTCPECGADSDVIPFEQCTGTVRCGVCGDGGFSFDLAVGLDSSGDEPGPAWSSAPPRTWLTLDATLGP